ncbi:MAG: diaminopimelate epimerase [Thermomicrobiales bacterium]|nr:diaminopimelate epimerase [Thermomicrobiales bacterium]
MNLPITSNQLIPFVKMSGSGNDFVVIDNRSGRLDPEVIPGFVRAICRRRLSIGADGAVLIEQPDPGLEVDFRFHYVNADGTRGEMCGNGAMCGARFAVIQGIARDECRFQTDAGIVEARVASDPADPAVSIVMSQPGRPRHGNEVDIDGRRGTYSAIQVGVPHAVTFVDDPDTFIGGFASPEFNAYGRAVRLHEAFAPAGTNVNIAGVRNRHTIRMRTYERGVEDETFACGTGAIATAIVGATLGLVSAPVSIIVSSGRTLTVDFDLDGDLATNVTLGGNACVVARGSIGPDALIE